MSNILVFVYLIFFVMLFAATFAFMWKMMQTTISDFNNPKRNIHPEMADVQTGEELLVFRSDEDNETDDDGDIIIIRK